MTAKINPILLNELADLVSRYSAAELNAVAEFMFALSSKRTKASLLAGAKEGAIERTSTSPKLKSNISKSTSDTLLNHLNHAMSAHKDLAEEIHSMTEKLVGKPIDISTNNSTPDGSSKSFQAAKRFLILICKMKAEEARNYIESSKSESKPSSELEKWATIISKRSA